MPYNMQLFEVYEFLGMYHASDMIGFKEPIKNYVIFRFYKGNNNSSHWKSFFDWRRKMLDDFHIPDAIQRGKNNGLPAFRIPGIDKPVSLFSIEEIRMQILGIVYFRASAGDMHWGIYKTNPKLIEYIKSTCPIKFKIKSRL